MTYSYPQFRDIDALRSFVMGHGNHFFDAATLRFFSSRISDVLYGGRFFVTSERNGILGDHPRTYTVRFVRVNDGSGHVDVTDAHREWFTSRSAAHRRAQWLAANVDAGTDPFEYDTDAEWL